MTGRDGFTAAGRGAPLAVVLLLTLTPVALSVPGAAHAQSSLPSDQIQVSVTLGGHFLVGLGYTRWIEEHHALEFTVFPFAHPNEGFPFGVRVGYAWVPSNEVWRAKLGVNATLLIRPDSDGGDRFTPTLGLTPGIQYDPDPDRSFRGDLWMSYYLKQKVFVPTGIEFFYMWPR